MLWADASYLSRPLNHSLGEAEFSYFFLLSFQDFMAASVAASSSRKREREARG